MSLQRSLDELERLLSVSRGQVVTLPSGRERRFVRLGKVSSQDLVALQMRIGKNIPQDYRQIMERLGACQLYADERGEIEFLSPAELADRFGDFFEVLEVEFKRLLPVAVDSRLQEIVAVVLDRQEPDNLLIMPHDVPPEDWVDVADEGGTWTSLEGWLAELIASEGDMEPH